MTATPRRCGRRGRWPLALLPALRLPGHATRSPRRPRPATSKGYVVRRRDDRAARAAATAARRWTSTGTTLDGHALVGRRRPAARSSSSTSGARGARPCVAEAPDLQKAWAAYSAAGKPVQFMGIDYREAPAAGAAFLRGRTRSPTPRLADDGGRTILALQGKAATTPTTLVLDRQGRIAARVAGQVTGAHAARPGRRRAAERRRVTARAAGTTRSTAGALPLAWCVALVAGLVSFASPCVLPLVPGFLGYVTGLSDVPRAARPRPAGARRAALRPRLHASSSSPVDRVASAVGAAADRAPRRCSCASAGSSSSLMALVFLGGWAAQRERQLVVAPGGRPGRRAAARRGLRARLGALHRPDPRAPSWR